MISRTLTLISVGAFLLVPVRASEEGLFLTRLKTVTLTTQAMQTGEFGEIKATYSYSPVAKTQKLQGVSLEHRGKKMEVPQQSLARHPDIVIESARVSSEPGYDTQPWIYLSFQLRGDKEKRYYIAFNDGKFAKTFIHP
jgi:hypothetical protein